MTSPPNNGDTPWLGRSYDTDKLFQRLISSGEFFNKSYDPSQFFKSLVNNITNKPYWVKQALFLELRDDIKRMTSIELIEAIDKNDLLQLYAPKISALGKKILQDSSFASTMNLSPMVVGLIRQADGNKNVIDLCHDNKWSLKLFAQLIIEADSKGIIEEIRSRQILYIFKFLADEIYMGDLLVKLNKITMEQLSDDLTELEYAKIKISHMMEHRYSKSYNAKLRRKYEGLHTSLQCKNNIRALKKLVSKLQERYEANPDMMKLLDYYNQYAESKDTFSLKTRVLINPFEMVTRVIEPGRFKPEQWEFVA